MSGSLRQNPSTAGDSQSEATAEVEPIVTVSPALRLRTVSRLREIRVKAAARVSKSASPSGVSYTPNSAAPNSPSNALI